MECLCWPNSALRAIASKCNLDLFFFKRKQIKETKTGFFCSLLKFLIGQESLQVYFVSWTALECNLVED